MIASLANPFALAAFVALLCMAVRVAGQDVVCPYDYSLLPVGDASEIERRFLAEEGVDHPIEVIEQGGDYVDFVVHNTAAFSIVPDHIFVQHSEGAFFSAKCNFYGDLGAGEATEVKRAHCVKGEYAVVWVYSRSVTPGEHSASIPKCCHDPHAENVPVDANTWRFAYEIKCTPSCDDPVDKATGSPSDTPTDRAPRRSLQEEIIKDMMPSSSGQCSGYTANTSYDFVSSQAESKWNANFAPFEEELFLAKMQHIDSNDDRSWTIRFGQAGNIYSMVGPMGETVPPQDHTNAPWVDEVWQAVQPLGSNGDHDNDPDTGPYFIHEAGIYTKDGDNTAIPFYSPTIGSYCNDAEGECGFASWGQHAHVPTPWKSPMLYLNRYVNCGNGVFEYTTLRHNIAGSGETFTYMNVPWGGTRRSVLGDIVLSKKSTQELVPIYPLKGWGEGANTALKDTMGFTVFAEDLPKNPNPLHDQPYTDLPNGLNFERNNNDCYCEGNCAKASHRYVCPLVSQTVNVGWSPNRGSPGLMVRLEGEDSKESIVAGVRHWAGNNKLYFYQNDDLTLDKVKAALTKGTKINVFHYYPSDEGKPEEENLALAHVHGGQDGSGNYPRVRYGMAGRDYNVYTVNDIPSIGPGSTYYYRQYFMMDRYTEMKTKGMEWATEPIKATKGQGTIDGRSVALYKSTTNTFGFAVSEDTCRQADAVQVCEGWTTPKENWKPLFEIYCGEDHVVTDNLYHFSPAGPPYRSYVCDGLSDTRPVWTLLGYFQEGNCIDIASDYEYDADYC